MFFGWEKTEIEYRCEYFESVEIIIIRGDCYRVVKTIKTLHHHITNKVCLKTKEDNSGKPFTDLTFECNPSFPCNKIL